MWLQKTKLFRNQKNNIISTRFIIGIVDEIYIENSRLKKFNINKIIYKIYMKLLKGFINWKIKKMGLIRWILVMRKIWMGHHT